MPPKKAAKKGGDSKDGEDVCELEDLCSNYIKACKTLGIDASKSIIATMTPEEEGSLPNLCTTELLGPAGVRSLCAAILGRGGTMKKGPYKPLRSLRFWRANAQDAGASAVADLLKMGPPDVNITHLEFMDNNIGPPGCRALGEALMLGANNTLMTLRLDHNDSIGTAGLVQLVKGLRTNRTVSNLFMSYCSIDEAGGRPLCQLLSFDGSNLKVLDLQGNRLGSKGLLAMTPALKTNSMLRELNIADNDLAQDPDDDINREAFAQLGEAMTMPEPVKLEKLDLMMNRIATDIAEILVRYLSPENVRITEFKLDDNLPLELFEKLCRMGGGGKKGKGKKGKGKKKK